MEDNHKIEIDIDDSFASQSKLELEIDFSLERVYFNPKLQHGFCDSFSLHLVDIDEMINYLIFAKNQLKP